jgi:protein involved in polysaccharide export with SLBB domain
MCYRLLCWLFVGLFVALAVPVASAQQAAPALPNAAAADDGYRLGSGDKIHVAVFGQPDLTGDFTVDGGGSVQLPLIGTVKAAGLTVGEFQKQVATKFSDGYFVNPNVEVDVVSYRPFYIIGEVRSPGQYPYVNGMSILNAVALAGGFTDRADKSEVYIRRNGASKEVEYPADETTKVNPGDIVRISERFF